MPRHDPLTIGSVILNIDIAIELWIVTFLANAGSPQQGYIGGCAATEMRGDLVSASPSPLTPCDQISLVIARQKSGEERPSFPERTTLVASRSLRLAPSVSAEMVWVAVT